MEEKEKMKILTQEEFDSKNNEKIHSGKFVVFENYIIKDICINYNNFSILTDIVFHRCIIESINVDYDIARLFGRSISFSRCEIVDYEKVECIDKYDITDCTFIKPVPFVCPTEGEFIGYKKCCFSFLFLIVKLLIPSDAKRSSAFGRKCRCSKARVLGIFDLDGNETKDIDKVFSDYDIAFTYKVGEWVYPDSFDENRFNECSSGIHFFMTFKEARDYHLR